jgi:hypothetical protein
MRGIILLRPTIYADMRTHMLPPPPCCHAADISIVHRASVAHAGRGERAIGTTLPLRDPEACPAVAVVAGALPFDSGASAVA